MSESACHPERRIAARIAVARDIGVVAGPVERPAQTVNVSTSGMLVLLDGTLTIWADVVVSLPEVGARAARVARRDGRHYGLVFREPLSADEFEAFTGHAIIGEAPVEPATIAPAKRPARTAPGNFGRDRFKTLKREAAERARQTER